MSSIYLPNSARLLDYASATKSSARKGSSTTVTIKIEVVDPVDAGYMLRELADIDRKQRNPYRPATRGRAERELAQEIDGPSMPLQLTYRREG